MKAILNRRAIAIAVVLTACCLLVTGCPGGGKTDKSLPNTKTKTDLRKADSQNKSPDEPKVEDIKQPVEQPGKKTAQEPADKPTQEPDEKPGPKPSAGPDESPDSQPAPAADPPSGT